MTSAPLSRATSEPVATLPDSRTETPARAAGLRLRDLLRVYAWYRVAIALILLGLFATGVSSSLVGTRFPALYLNTAMAYAGLNIAWLIYLLSTRFDASARRIGTILGCDILAFLLLIHASGGLDSGVGYLLLTTCSVGSMLLDKRMGAFLAAVASIAVIGQQLMGLVLGVASSHDVVSAGSLGILLFTSVSALQHLSGHILLANRKAEHERQQAQHMQRLAQQIVAQMDTGVMVLDEHDRVELINRAAQQLLGNRYHPGAAVNDPLRTTIDNLREGNHGRSGIAHGIGRSELKVSLARMPHSPETNLSTLVFLEDNRKLTQQAQQLKLASLGRLTGSIAHEVRNPLGAISHAAQLLAESPSISADDRHLSDIISRHCLRVNQIIENVMQLSRRRATNTRQLDLGDWLTHFLDDYRLEIDSGDQVQLVLPPEPVMAHFDPEQMAQVLTNLCNNGLMHSSAAGGSRAIELQVNVLEQRECAVLDVLDCGPGVAEEHRDKIFEPFFTTKSSGAGLGLYIARELCEANRARLSYRRTQDNRSCFRVEFASTGQQL